MAPVRLFSRRGLFATEDIPADRFLAQYAGILLSEEEGLEKEQTELSFFDTSFTSKARNTSEHTLARRSFC